MDVDERADDQPRPRSSRRRFPLRPARSARSVAPSTAATKREYIAREGRERDAERCNREQERRQERRLLSGQLAREQGGEDERQEKEHNRGQPQSLDPAWSRERHVLDEEVQRRAAAIEEHVGDDRGVRPLWRTRS